MKTILEKEKEMADMLEKQAAATIKPEHILPYMIVPGVLGMAGGKIYSDVTAPAVGEHETFQTELLKDRLVNMLEERKKQKELSKLEEVVSGSKRSLRI